MKVNAFNTPQRSDGSTLCGDVIRQRLNPCLLHAIPEIRKPVPLFIHDVIVLESRDLECLRRMYDKASPKPYHVFHQLILMWLSDDRDIPITGSSTFTFLD